MTVVHIQFPVTSFAPLEINSALQQTVSVGTIVARCLLFDDTTEEYANNSFEVPEDIDVSGIVTFRAMVSPATPAVGRNIALTFGHKATGDGEELDGVYTDEDSGDKAIANGTNPLTIVEWTETVSNLGWTANELVHYRLSRPQASANNLVGDMYLVDEFTIDIPVV